MAAPSGTEEAPNASDSGFALSQRGIGLRASGSGLRASGTERVDQTLQRANESSAVSVEPVAVSLRQKPQPMADAEQVPELGSAAKRHLEEMHVVARRPPRTALDDICRRRDRGPPELRNESKALLFRKRRGRPIDSNDKFVSHLEHLQL